MATVLAPPIPRQRYEQLARRARLLSWLSLAWMTVEGAVALVAGIGAGSIALIGFGLDSAIEGLASVIVIWRFTGHRVFSHEAEQRAQRLAVSLGSNATAGEGRQNMLCAYLAGALLLGLLGNALAGAWWLDPAVGLLVAAVAVKEGRDTWRGESCCAHC
jgi:divalent metal cation (Fe/Co/Zn/Cd) transporter